jgi:SAM-dependent methyltransferase
MSVERAILSRTRLPERKADEGILVESIESLEKHFGLADKIAREPETIEIVQELYDRVVAAYGRLSALAGKRILDLACGSSTSKAPSGMTRILPTIGAGPLRLRRASGYTSLFEPWLCRILVSLGAHAVGVDAGDLDEEGFEHYRLDLGQTGALDFLPRRSFDAVHDSRLFGSPEFTARFAGRGEVLRIAREIAEQEDRVLREDGIVLHSDAHELTGA